MNWLALAYEHRLEIVSGLLFISETLSKLTGGKIHSISHAIALGLKRLVKK